MSANQHGVDFEKVVTNAADQGIDLSEIALFYEGLTAEELMAMKAHNLVTEETQAVVIGRFNREGVAMFADKVVSVYSLSA